MKVLQLHYALHIPSYVHPTNTFELLDSVLYWNTYLEHFYAPQSNFEIKEQLSKFSF